MVQKVNANEFEITAGTTACRIRIDGRGIYALLDAAVQVKGGGAPVTMVDDSKEQKTLRVSLEGLSVDGTAVCGSIEALCGLLAEDIRRDMDVWAAAYPNVRQFLRLAPEKKRDVLAHSRSMERRRTLEWYLEQLI